jgi:putative tricarboxylic transport membrane protein
MKLKSWKNMYSGAVVVICGAFYYIAALSIRITKVGGAFHSRMVPQMIAVFIIALGFCLMARDIIPWLKGKGHGTIGSEEETDTLSIPEWIKGKKEVFLIFVLSFFYVGLLQVVGFIISTPFFLYCFITILSPSGRKKRHIFNILLSIVVTIVLYFLFRYGFTMMLPRGFLF